VPHISVYIKQHLYDRLYDEAKKKGVTISKLIRRVVEERYGD